MMTLSAPSSEHHSIKYDWLRSPDGSGAVEAIESMVSHEKAARVKTDSALGFRCGSLFVGGVNTQ